MIFQILMGLRKSRCDISSGTTQRWACLGARRGGAIQRAKFVGHQQKHQTQRIMKQVEEESDDQIFSN
jgi:hypothetical protein